MISVNRNSNSDSNDACVGRGDDTVGNPYRAQISQFELFQLILSSKLNKHFPVERLEATVSQSTVPSPLLQEEFVSLGELVGKLSKIVADVEDGLHTVVIRDFQDTV